MRKASTIGHSAPGALEARRGALRACATRLGPLALGHLGRQDERVLSWRRLLSAYDVDRQLERGYSLTLTADGALVRSAGAVGEGQEIVTRFADGTVRSTVEGGGRADDAGGGPRVTVPGDPVPVEQLSFTEASRELNAIVDFFEQREVDVDVLVARLERATRPDRRVGSSAAPDPRPGRRAGAPPGHVGRRGG